MVDRYLLPLRTVEAVIIATMLWAGLVFLIDFFLDLHDTLKSGTESLKKISKELEDDNDEQ